MDEQRQTWREVTAVPAARYPAAHRPLRYVLGSSGPHQPDNARATVAAFGGGQVVGPAGDGRDRPRPRGSPRVRLSGE
jgi:hypothetical protein